MVIFLFLRSLSATIIPSIAVPLSLIGTFGVMYLLGYSLDNLSLMALTISTGFVVDDAIVMIENISRFIEEGETPLAGRAQGRRADRIHHSVADRFADRGADPAAVHGRHRRQAVPRICGHAGGDDPGVGGRLADSDADDVREAAASTRRRSSRPGSTARRRESSRTPSRFTVARSMGARPSDWRRCWSRSATLVLTILLYIVVPKGFFPVQDTGVIQGVSEAPQSVSFAAMARSGSRISPRSSCRIPRSRACRHSSASTAPTPPSTAAAF